MVDYLDEIRCGNARLVQIASGICQRANDQVRDIIIQAREKGVGGVPAQAVFLQRCRRKILQISG